ncbi:acyltransferase [Dactylosporangium sp. NPDC051485]|uniref:acyltransferase family protein n=1 Tax=Dactylosporangium sp. NPDC051485 TaxID=3154846 RepID=UPI0034315197
MTMAPSRTAESPARGWAARIAAGTPAHRDRTIDALRAVAIIGVILGHWMVSAVVSDQDHTSALHGASPLSHSPQLAPASWFLQTLGPFFFAGGYASARGLANRRSLPWLSLRLSRLARPVLALAAVWVPAMLLLAAVGAPDSTRHVTRSLVSHPLWFLLVYIVLTAFAPLLRPLVVRAGAWAVLPMVALVALTDAVRPHGLPLWWELLAVLAAWMVPYMLGIALSESRLDRRAGTVLLALGVFGGAVLLLGAGYPASAVGVPGDRWSNLDPPSLFAMALAFAQLGVFLLLRPWLARLLRRPAAWAPVAGLNLNAMTLFCWHQTALLLVTFAGLLVGPLPGLLDEPDGSWPLHRLAWLPLFALVLVGLNRVFHRFESAGGPRRSPGPTKPVSP